MYTYVSSIVHLYTNMTQLDYSYVFTSCMYLHIYSAVLSRNAIQHAHTSRPSCGNY